MSNSNNYYWWLGSFDWNGWICPTCGQWCQYGTSHYCPGPNYTPSWITTTGGTMSEPKSKEDQIIDLLEEIRDLLKKRTP
jgi:hypothetical protein